MIYSLLSIVSGEIGVATSFTPVTHIQNWIKTSQLFGRFFIPHSTHGEISSQRHRFPEELADPHPPRGFPRSARWFQLIECETANVSKRQTIQSTKLCQTLRGETCCRTSNRWVNQWRNLTWPDMWRIMENPSGALPNMMMGTKTKRRCKMHPKNSHRTLELMSTSD